MNLNKAIISGRLTRDPELKALPSGQNVCNFSLATSENYTDKDGNKQESSEFHNITVYGKQAENCAKYLVKGQQALVEGKLATRSWEKDDVKHYRTEIVAMSVQFGAKSGGEAKNEAPSAPEKKEENGEEDINPADIPF